MKQGKDTKRIEGPGREPQIKGFSSDEFFTNRLQIPDEVKQRMAQEGVDGRFINALQFRENGNVHRSHWTPYVLKDSQFANAEGLICRGDLILASRPKSVSLEHRKFLNKRNNLQKSHNKTAAEDLRKTIRDAGLGESSRVLEGYDEAGD